MQPPSQGLPRRANSAGGCVTAACLFAHARHVPAVAQVPNAGTCPGCRLAFNSWLAGVLPGPGDLPVSGTRYLPRPRFGLPCSVYASHAISTQDPHHNSTPSPGSAIHLQVALSMRPKVNSLEKSATPLLAVERANAAASPHLHASAVVQVKKMYMGATAIKLFAGFSNC